MSPQTEWDDDSPQGRQIDMVIMFLNLLWKAGCFMAVFHFLHLVFIFIVTYFRERSHVNKFCDSWLFKVTRVVLCAALILSHSVFFFALAGMAWSLCTFATDDRLMLYTISFTIIAFCAFIFVLVSMILCFACSKTFMFEESSVKGKLYYILAEVRKVMESRRKWIAVFAFLFLLWVSLCILAGTHGLCVPNEPVSDVSSTITRIITRKLGMDPYCSDTGVCYVYLLVPNDLSTQMHVVFHSTEEPRISAVRYGKSPDKLDTQIVGRYDKLNNYELDRYISSVVLNDLEPGSTYYFQALIYPDTNGYTSSDVGKFRTAPVIDSNGSSMENLNYVVASDIGKTDAATAIAQAIAKEEPLFLAIGGDLAYENGYQACYCRYDWLLNEFQNTLVTPKGYTIPILASIGNHEAGGTYVHPSKIPFFLDYFPYADSSTNTDDYLTAHSSARKYGSLYHSHTFGDKLLQFIVLDSGHSVEKGGAQRDWLEATLKNSQHFQYRVALYHVPLYPARRSPDNIHSVDSRDQWLDLFDKYHLTVAFENHDHVYKRTHVLKNNEISATGTVYMGDGAWGVIPHNPSSEDRWYLAQTHGNTNYYMTVSLNALWLQGNAKDANGVCFDEVLVF